MRRMLINATQPEELRVALVDGQKLYDLDIEAVGREQKKSNIYMGKIMRVEPSLEAAFVDYGADRHGFLPLKEIARSLFKDKGKGSHGRVNIKDVIDEGQELIVQVEKEERGNKGAALTTFISLAGRYLVAMPNNPRAGGVSRQIEGEDRDTAKAAMAELSIPSDIGLILRTAGVGKSSEELQWDLDYLLQLWDAIKEASASAKPPFLIYQEQNVIIRAIRDYLRNDIAEILVDDETLHATAKKFMEQVMPHNLGKLKLYNDSVPLFTRYQIESQIQSAFSREVRLPSGGSIVIEPTEALTTIDINSAKATQGGDIEETALKTNLEAADEVGTQLRLRDLGGLVVVDFIDMLNQKNQRAVENRLRDATKVDRARVQLGRISRFGLLEMSRQRIRPALAEASHEICPRCSGMGTIRGTRSTALGVIRLLEEEAMKESTAKVMAQVPIDVATYLLNEKRQDISGIEERLGVKILLIPNQNLETPHYEVERIRQQDSDRLRATEESVSLVEETTPISSEDWQEAAPAAARPLVREIERNGLKPVTAKPGGFLARLFSALAGPSDDHNGKAPAKQKAEQQENKRSKQSSGQGKRGSDSAERGRKSNQNKPKSKKSNKPADKEKRAKKSQSPDKDGRKPKSEKKHRNRRSDDDKPSKSNNDNDRSSNNRAKSKKNGDRNDRGDNGSDKQVATSRSDNSANSDQELGTTTSAIVAGATTGTIVDTTAADTSANASSHGDKTVDATVEKESVSATISTNESTRATPADEAPLTKTEDDSQNARPDRNESAPRRETSRIGGENADAAAKTDESDGENSNLRRAERADTSSGQGQSAEQNTETGTHKERVEDEIEQAFAAYEKQSSQE